MKNGRYAAIDIGTVTTRMLIADVADGNVADCVREYTITNLGEGVDATGVLKPEAIQRVGEAIDRYLAVRASFECDGQKIPTAVMATSAARDAQNAEEFVEVLARKGLTLQVIPGNREAALSFLGASSSFADGRIMLVDIGGGSTEIAIGDTRRDPLWSHSFDVGCRRMTERFFAHDPIELDEMQQASAWVRDVMTPYFVDLAQQGYLRGENAGEAANGAGDSKVVPVDRVVAVAGTATSVVSIRDEMEEYDSSRVHRAVVTAKELDGVLGQLSALTVEERRHVVGLDPERAPVIVAGLVILKTVLELAGFRSYTASETDLLHGMVLVLADGEF